LASVTRCRIADLACASNADDHEHSTAEFREIAHFANSIGLGMDHVPAAEKILTNGDQASL
jgi:hypothetical protein